MFTGSNRVVACITLMHFSLTEKTTIAPLPLWRYVFITYLCYVFLLNEILLSIQLAILYMFVYVYVYMLMGRDGFFALIKYQYHDQDGRHAHIW